MALLTPSESPVIGVMEFLDSSVAFLLERSVITEICISKYVNDTRGTIYKNLECPSNGSKLKVHRF